LYIFNKNQLATQWEGNIKVGFYFKYKTKIWGDWIWIVQFNYNALNVLDIAKFKIGDCKEKKVWQYYVNLTPRLCLMSNTKIKNVKFKFLSEIAENKKVYPNILWIPWQIGPINITIPLMFWIFVFLFVLWFYFFKKKYSLWKNF
jgi:hypothetical protein